MSETWTEILTVTPRPARYRTRCTNDGCSLAQWPVRFPSLDTAEAWARDHAFVSTHEVVVDALTVVEP